MANPPFIMGNPTRPSYCPLIWNVSSGTKIFQGSRTMIDKICKQHQVVAIEVPNWSTAVGEYTTSLVGKNTTVAEAVARNLQFSIEAR